MPTDSVLSWGILLLLATCGFAGFIAAVIRADEARFQDMHESEVNGDLW